VRKKSLSNSYLTLAVAGAGIVLPSIANAQDASPYEIRISGGLEASSNPFLLEQGTEAVSAYVAIDPTIFLEDGKDTTVIDGSLRATQYFNEYGTDANGRLRLATQRALSERTELELSASITSTRRSFVDGLTSGSSNLPFADPTALPDPVSLDPTLIGELVRSTEMFVSGSIEHKLSPLSSLRGSGTFSRSSFSNNAGFDFSNASASLAYGRQVASQTVVSIGGQFASFDFAGGDVGDARVYTLQATVEHEIGTRWSLAVSGGVDLVDRNLGVLGRETSTLFSGDLGLCNRGLRTRFCVTGQRAAQPAAIGGVAIVTSVGVSYKLELSRNDVLSFNSQFGRSNQTLDNGFATTGTVVDVFGASANFSHNLSERAAFIVALGYSDVSDDLRDVPANAFVRVGITLGFGRQM
jgi:hypothetical protein